MSSICETVKITCCRNEESVILRLFCARRMKRRLTSTPNPCNKGCVTWNRTLVAIDGLKKLSVLLLATRELSNVPVNVVPGEKPCKYWKFPVEVWVVSR